MLTKGSDMKFSDYKNKKVLIVGGAGAVGSNLTKKLADLGSSVMVLDNLSSGYTWLMPDSPNLLFIEGDICSDIDLKRVFAEKPDIVFHLAAFFANQNSVDYPEKDLETNGMGTLKLYEYASLCGVEKIVYASSGCSIYGRAKMPYVEEIVEPMHLSTPYQITKMLGELYGNYFLRQTGLPITYARFFNSYGPGEVPGQYRNVIPNFIYWAMQGKALPITGTGEETRDFTFVGDIVDGLLTMGLSGPSTNGEAYNLATQHERKIVDLARLINELTGNSTPILFKERRKWDSKPRLCASNEKARTQLGLEFDLDFESRIRETIAWFSDNWETISNSADFGPGMSSAVRK